MRGVRETTSPSHINSPLNSAITRQTPDCHALHHARFHGQRAGPELPTLAEADLTGFGAALGEVQRITGGWFAPAQGGVFAPGETRDLVERLRDWGAVGVGQSSWGPAVYGIVADAAASQALAQRVRGVLGAGGAGGPVYEGSFSDTGARVWRGDNAV